MYKLLLVDDESIIREGIRRMIDWEKLRITLTGSCSSAPAALESMMDDMPDILMTDVRMPGMDGLELAERAVKLHPGLRCIILSGYDEFAYAQRAMRAGAMEYLLKPCAQEEMEGALLRACTSIDGMRALSTERFEQRQARVADLAARLGALLPDAQGVITPGQVREAGRTASDPSQMRDALVDLVMKSTLGATQMEWSFRAVQDAYNLPAGLEEHIARTLTRMREKNPERRAFVAQMLDYVRENYACETLSLQYIADQVVYMNADYISKAFLKETGMKFSAYLLSVRMHTAKALMAGNVQLHTYEIAQRVGMGNNPHYFSNVFKKMTGMTPKEYKNQVVFVGKPEK
jgi:two-component system response regulator YesN